MMGDPVDPDHEEADAESQNLREDVLQRLSVQGPRGRSQVEHEQCDCDGEHRIAEEHQPFELPMGVVVVTRLQRLGLTVAGRHTLR
jgi:hypothetical protein